MSRHSLLLLFAAILAVALLPSSSALAAAMNNDDPEAITKNYDECLCWNATTAEMCAATNDTHKDACNNFTRAAMWYWVPVVAAAAIAMLLFPCIFACGRACNCCGGRLPSYGCCCPEADMDRRLYSNATVVSAKVIAVVLVVTLIGLTAWSIASHVRLADSVGRLQGNFTQTATLVANLRAELWTASDNLDSIIDVPEAIVSMDAEDFLYDAGNTTRRISAAVKGLGYFSILALLTSVIVLILGGCGVIGLPLTLAAMFFAFLTAIYLVALIAIGIPAQLTAFACDDGPRLNSSTRFMYQALNIEEVAASVTNASHLVELNYLTFLCDNVSLASLCDSGKYNCDASFCGNLSLSNADATYARLVPTIFVRTPQEGSLSIVDCADAGAANCSDAAVASAVVKTYSDYDAWAAKFSLARNNDLARLVTAAPVDEMIQAICDGDRSLRSRLRSPAGFHVVMALAMVFGLVVGLYGAKRFRSGPRDAKVEELAAEPPMPMYPAEYRETRDEAAMVDIVPGVPVYGIPMEHTMNNQPVAHVMDVAIDVDQDPHVVPVKSAAPF